MRRGVTIALSAVDRRRPEATVGNDNASQKGSVQNLSTLSLEEAVNPESAKDLTLPPSFIQWRLESVGCHRARSELIRLSRSS